MLGIEEADYLIDNNILEEKVSATTGLPLYFYVEEHLSQKVCCCCFCDTHKIVQKEVLATRQFHGLVMSIMKPCVPFEIVSS